MICNTCGIEKPLTEFYFMKDKKVYRKKCKVCMRKVHQEYRDYHRTGKARMERTDLYVKYYTLLITAKDIQEKYKLKRMFYQEPFSNITKDIVWENMCEKMQ
jgi:hypothetical protein